MKLTVALFLLSALLLVLASCSAPPAAVAGAVAAVGASVTAIVQAVEPLLPPEQVAKLQATAASIDGTVQATQLALATISDVITAFKGSVGTQMQTHVDALNKTAAAIADMPSRSELYLASGGSLVGGTAASRAMSAIKHGFAGKHPA